MKQIAERIKEILPEVRELRHTLHRHPELGYEEHETAGRLLAFLGEYPGMEIRSGVAGTGIVVTFGKDRTGAGVALRADMDALAIEEASGVEWASEVPGRMHACGHDGHMAMLAGAARLIAENEASLKGPVKLIFQPAEEGGAGGRAMVEAGVLEDPPVEAIYGLHNNLPDPGEKIGKISASAGAAMAGTGTFDIEIIGVGGHAAFPHRCVDPVYIGACVVEQLQGLVSRTLNPLESGVVSVTRFEAGTAHNIIPGKALLQGTFRALDNALLERLRDQIRDRAAGIAKAHGAEVRIRCERGYPVLVNHPLAEAAFGRILEDWGRAERFERVAPNMGGEDFAFYTERIPGFFYFLPACPAEKESIPMCHSPRFDFNDDLLPEGILLHAATALGFADHWEG
ncbi:MAG: M20 family metallopeptidase [Oceanipulchritudo sp.]